MTNDKRREQMRQARRREREKRKLIGPEPNPPATKKCYKCNEVKPYDTEHFHTCNTKKYWLRDECKPCTHRRVKLRQNARKYGFTDQEYTAARAKSCAICGSTKKTVVDHCHTTGSNRDTLCDLCNRGLGYFKDDPERMEAAAEYIRKHRLLS